MIELPDDFSERVSKRDEVDYVLVLVERPSDFGAHCVIVSMETLADVASKRNEMSGAENELFFLKKNSVCAIGGFCSCVRHD